MSKESITVAIEDFACARKNNIFVNALMSRFNMNEIDTRPDFLLYSCFGSNHLKYSDAVKIFLCDENVYPDFNTCDYAVGSVMLECPGKYLWLPPCFSTYLQRTIEPLPALEPGMAKRKFCSFIYSQCVFGKGSRLRKEFCERLMQYKHVDCPGRILHNMEAPELAARKDFANWNASKIKFLSNYKYNIAFENSSTRGYITEKLMDAYLANTVPIYFGSEGELGPFPKESMIYANDYDSLDALAARVREVDENDELYMQILAANPLRNGMKIEPDRLLMDFLQPIFAKKREVEEKDPLKAADVYRFHRLAWCGKWGMYLQMLKLMIQGFFYQFILGDKGKRERCGIDYWQIKYALRDMDNLLASKEVIKDMKF